MIPTADEYMNEPVQYAALQLIDVPSIASGVTESYKNVVLSRINQHCLRLAVFEGDYRWHYHPTSDELFIVVEGCLVIDLPGGQELRLLPWQCATIPANARHRTRAIGRTVNLCFEELAAETVFLEDPTDLVPGQDAIS